MKDLSLSVSLSLGVTHALDPIHLRALQGAIRTSTCSNSAPPSLLMSLFLAISRPRPSLSLLSPLFQVVERWLSACHLSSNHSLWL